jgi:hypothetical protein
MAPCRDPKPVPPEDEVKVLLTGPQSLMRLNQGLSLKGREKKHKGRGWGGANDLLDSTAVMSVRQELRTSTRNIDWVLGLGGSHYVNLLAEEYTVRKFCLHHKLSVFALLQFLGLQMFDPNTFLLL